MKSRSATQIALYALSSILYTLLLSCRSTPPPKPLAELSAHETRGYRIFTARCALCHYDRQEGPLHGPSLLGIYKKPYLPSGAPANDERVTATIQHGRKMMPAQPDIDPNDLDDLLAYLHTL